MGSSSSEIAGKTRDSILLVRKKRSRNVSSVISRVDRMRSCAMEMLKPVAATELEVLLN